MSIKCKPLLIATPYSQLFGDAHVKEDIVRLSDLIEIRGPDQILGTTASVLWHCELSIVRQWSERHFVDLSRVVDGFLHAGVELEAASFHIPSRYQVNEVKEGAFVGQGRPMSDEQMLANAEINCDAIRTLLKESGFANTPLLLENNNHLGTDAYESVTAPAFVCRLLDVTGFGLLLDVAHARITAANTDQQEESYFSRLPMERAEQIHLSRHGFRDGKAFDAHDALSEDDWQFFHRLMPKLPNLRFVTIEFYKDAGLLARLLKRLRIELMVYEDKIGEFA